LFIDSLFHSADNFPPSFPHISYLYNNPLTPRRFLTRTVYSFNQKKDGQTSRDSFTNTNYAILTKTSLEKL